MKLFSALAVSFLATAAKVKPVIAAGHEAPAAPTTPSVEAVEYADGDFPLIGYVSIPEGATETPVPGVVIVVRLSDDSSSYCYYCCYIKHRLSFHVICYKLRLISIHTLFLNHYWKISARLEQCG